MDNISIYEFANDQGLLIDMLLCIELCDWSRFGAAAGWTRTSLRNAKRIMRFTVRQKRVGLSPRSLCLGMDVTGLWALLTEDCGSSEVNGNDSVMVKGLPDPLEIASDDSLLMRTLKGQGKDVDVMVSWLLTLTAAKEAVVAKNWYGQTALHLCARYGQSKSARCILQFPHVAVDAVDMYDVTPLIEAVRYEQTGMVAVLLAAGADPNAFVPNCHCHGQTPLSLAVRLKNFAIVARLVRDPRIDLHKSTSQFVSVGKAAIDFAPSSGPVRAILDAAIDAEGHRAQKLAKLPDTALVRHRSRAPSISTDASTPTSWSPPSRSSADSVSSSYTSSAGFFAFEVQNSGSAAITKTETSCCAGILLAMWRNPVRQMKR
eukprot:TRINITY_DN15615_c0_g1_i1.p1 TRINITY_DN15615_c0_g1~~TRINITY_DN15615_c0_g1_i1.p1  ORF type:complete len:374 (+),score=40.48 TRINITY_DN15615_c0_g1_i1:64-1185(+)